ncbi:alpha/beta fold hydrolase [Amycolatopsis sp. NPDC059657]|uniref:alpha/beta fold hydrolase n=1 Tax=Amycolatopsis sp. NPDC059657 TaxID=3346899 RepID=UPI00366E3CB7
MTETIARVNGIEICYETFGEPSARPLLLIMGLGGPMIWWDDEFCRSLVDRGFYVIRFDNRDVGRSTKMHGRISPLATYWLRTAPYTLDDMADDAAGLLDELGIRAAHVAGASMGGMISQTLAIRHPERVISLTSIMSTTGNRLVGRPTAKAGTMLLGRPPKNREQYLDYLVRTFRIIGSPGYPFDVQRMRDRAARTFDRGLNRGGTIRQLAAIVSSKDRAPALRKLRIPAMVIHGARDPLVHVSGGRATAKAIPDAELDIVPGMGHDMPRALWPRLIDAITRTANRAGIPAY